MGKIGRTLGTLALVTLCSTPILISSSIVGGKIASRDMESRVSEVQRYERLAENCWYPDIAARYYERAAEASTEVNQKINYLNKASEKYRYTADVHNRWGWFPGESEIAKYWYQKAEELMQRIEELKSERRG